MSAWAIMATDHTSLHRIDAIELRKIFNEERIYERALSGELQVVVLEDRHPSLPLAREPYCTKSQMLSYRRDGLEVARAHMYLRPDGTIGASGLPDPKRVVVGDKMFRLPKGRPM